MGNQAMIVQHEPNVHGQSVCQDRDQITSVPDTSVGATGTLDAEHQNTDGKVSTDPRMEQRIGKYFEEEKEQQEPTNGNEILSKKNRTIKYSMGGLNLRKGQFTEYSASLGNNLRKEKKSKTELQNKSKVKIQRNDNSSDSPNQRKVHMKRNGEGTRYIDEGTLEVTVSHPVLGQQSTDRQSILGLNDGKHKEEKYSFNLKSSKGIVLEGSSEGNCPNASHNRMYDISREYERITGRDLERLTLVDPRAEQIVVTSAGDSLWIIPSTHSFSRHSGVCAVLGDRKSVV